VLSLTLTSLSKATYQTFVVLHSFKFANYAKSAPHSTLILLSFLQMPLVLSKLDYCNSLFYSLPDTSISRLQRVQNSLARVVVPSIKRSQHISPTLCKLHWLPVHQRIQYKIAALTFKTLYHKQPSYLVDLLLPYVPTRNLRSSDKHLLTVPNIKSAIGRRSFQFAAPTIWNTLPLSLRSSTSLHSFLTGLKTHLFPP
jgi:hypothetical protein